MTNATKCDRAKNIYKLKIRLEPCNEALLTLAKNLLFCDDWVDLHISRIKNHFSLVHPKDFKTIPWVFSTKVRITFLHLLICLVELVVLQI